MQLIVVSLIMVFFFFSQDLKAQIRSQLGKPNADPSKQDSIQTELSVFEYPNWDAIDVDFLSSYYQQNGNNAAVTGGLGTELLTDFTQKLIISAPLKPRLTLKADGGYDYYTSASSDNIDPVYSDDSAADTRVHGNLGLQYDLDPQQTVGFRVGGSVEYDYWSSQFGVNYSRLSKNENTALSLQAQTFIDYWTLIYPVELRRQGALLDRNDRQSYNASATLSQVLTKKMQASVQLEATLMNGLLSTPFHRVYFQGEQLPQVERLPDTRLKVPIGFRLNRYLTDWLMVRAYYRYYWDSWGINAHTASIELPIKLNRFLAVTPFYRFHTQTAADYFLPFGQHEMGSQFFTSDHDLAALNSHSFGAGINYQPAGGVFKVKVPFKKKDKKIHLKNLDLKYAHYERSTGMKADIVSFGMGFSIY